MFSPPELKKMLELSEITVKHLQLVVNQLNTANEQRQLTNKLLLKILENLEAKNGTVVSTKITAS